MKVLRTIVMAVIMATALLAPNALPARADAGLQQVQMNLAGLAHLSYSGVDGADGPTTRAAVRSFQISRCLVVDGVAGPATTSELSAVMRLVQEKVGADADGLNGPRTKAAIQRWQEAHGLAGDGQAGPATFAAMGLQRSLDCGFVKPTPTGNSVVNGPITRTEILGRAHYWVDQNLPYSQQTWWPGPGGKYYRQDCSGLVSMALHLNDAYTTRNLDRKMIRITKDELRPGDVVGNLGNKGGNGHTMIFEAWIDRAEGTFWSLEERGTAYGAVRERRTFGSYYGTEAAWRYVNVVD